MEFLGVNTVEIPVYWEQMEPEPGQFDFSVVDTLLTQAREHGLRLVLLWFGTWKNGSAHLHARMDEARAGEVSQYRRRGRQAGGLALAARARDTPSRHSGFHRALMGHLKGRRTRQHTVLMVQVENEPGAWGSVRDFSPAAQRLFEGPVPAELLTALGSERAGANWTQVFGKDADEFFHAWSVAHFIGQVAAAGKAVYPLPLYANAALRDPLAPPQYPPRYESGGPTDNVLDIWKAAAPALDLLAPDIYLGDSPRCLRVLELYARPDNALLVPEIGPIPGLRPVLLRRAGAGCHRLRAVRAGLYRIRRRPARRVPGHGRNACAIRPELPGSRPDDARDRPAGTSRASLQAEVEQDDVKETEAPPRTLDFGAWQATVAYGLPSFGDAVPRRAATRSRWAGRSSPNSPKISSSSPASSAASAFTRPAPRRAARGSTSVWRRAATKTEHVPDGAPVERRPDRLGPQLRLGPAGAARVAFHALRTRRPPVYKVRLRRRDRRVVVRLGHLVRHILGMDHPARAV